MEVVLLSDTHIPSRAATLPPWVRDIIQTADHVIHAGDVDSQSAYVEIRELADGDLTAVAGNTDGAYPLPSVATVDVDATRFVVTHGTGSQNGYVDRVAATVAEQAAATGSTVGVAGHTHEVLDITASGYRVLNPGSATGAWPAQEATLMVADVTGGDIDVEIHRE